MNIMILSCGTRNKIVQYFKRELAGIGQVIASDCSRLAPALYDADKYFIVPSIDKEEYLDEVLSICKNNGVKAILSLIDPELSVLAANKDKFLSIGTIPIISDHETVEICFNKYKMHELLVNNRFKTIKSYLSKETFYKDVEAGTINYPVFVKPVKGSASININKVFSKEEIELLYKNMKT